MKNLRAFFIPVILVLCLQAFVWAAAPKAGFSLPDSVESMTLKYRSVRDLIVLPVTINDSVTVELVLDTGCRNLILFGKRFARQFNINSSRKVEFSGLGTGKPVSGSLSVGNKVDIHQVLGEQIPIVIVPGNNVFNRYENVDGVIGYDIFVKFEIELDPSQRTITFRPAQRSSAPNGYTTVPLRIVDSRPVMESNLYLRKGEVKKLELMIDTGSSLGLLLKTTNIAEFATVHRERVLGFGLNGPVSGYQMTSDKLKAAGLELTRVQTGVVSSNWHDNASIGMDVLKDYVVILNYCKQYACFRKFDV